MASRIEFTVCIAAILCAPLAIAQVPSNSNSPVGFVYVSSSPNKNSHQIDAFAATSDGKLTPISGSPFPADVQNMAVNRKYLFGTDGVDIYSFSIASDGALKLVATINAQQFNGYNCGGPVALFLDHDGATLYDLDYDGNSCANNTYQFLSIDESSGELSYLGMSSDSTPEFEMPLSFTGNNIHAYGSGCFHFSSMIYGFQRNRDQKLTALKINPSMPVSKKADFFCPGPVSADPENHVAISVQALNGQTWQPDGPPQLATYTADNSGNLTSKSNYRNMPKSAVQAVMDIQVSPSGKLLAVGGTAGLQAFHFNGGNPMTHYTGLLTRDEVDQMFWDNDNHLYAVSGKSGKLYVFTITPTSASQAPGSPYTVTNAQNLIVLPEP